MKQLQQLVCLAFIRKQTPSLESRLLGFLPLQEATFLKNLPPPSGDLTQELDLEQTLLSTTDPSWFTPFLRTLSEHDLLLFLSALPEALATLLQKQLGCSLLFTPLPQQLTPFFQKQLISSFAPETLLPIQALPVSSLNELLSLLPEQMKLLVEFLGLHDLAVELRQIIDGFKLKKIRSIFSQDKLLFLSLLSQKREPVVFKKMELNAWDGKQEDLLHLIYQRGMNRLGKALYSENPHLISHIKLRMTRDDAELLSSFHKNLEHPKARALLCTEVLDTLHFLQQLKLKNAS